MAVNSQGELSSKENEIATAQIDLLWDAMTVEEIHARLFDDTAIVSGFISAQGKSREGETINAKVRFFTALVRRKGKWQLVGTQSASLRQTPRRPDGP